MRGTLMKLVVGTRGSALATRQTADVVAALQSLHPDLVVETRIIQTKGDLTQAENIPLASFGDKGIFARELESALLAGEIDFAVHSMKDLAHTLPEGLTIAAIPERQDPRDVIIGRTLGELSAPGLRIGTGSARRRALLFSRFPDLTAHEIRGNIDTRLRKLRDGGYDAIILAMAGLARLGLQDQVTEALDPEWFVPDPGQGALAIQTRAGDNRVIDLVSALTHRETQLAVEAERSFLRAVGGGCHTPVGALAIVSGGTITLSAMLAASESARATVLLRASESAPIDEALSLGTRVARALTDRNNPT